MTDKSRNRTSEPSPPRRRLLPWLILLVVLAALMTFISLRGVTEKIDQDGSSNSDVPGATNTTGPTDKAP